MEREGERERERERITSSRYSRLSVRIGDRCKIIMSAAAPMRRRGNCYRNVCNINLISIKYSRRYAFAEYNLPSNYQFVRYISDRVRIPSITFAWPVAILALARAPENILRARGYDIY